MSVLIVEPLMKLLPVMKSSLFPSTKSKDVGWREKKVHLELQKDAIVRAFYVTGKLTSDCAWCIYDKVSLSSLFFVPEFKGDLWLQHRIVSPLQYTSATSVTFLVNFVTTLIIPPTVFNMDVRLPLALDEGLRRSLPFFLRGLHNLGMKQLCLLKLNSENCRPIHEKKSYLLLKLFNLFQIPRKIQQFKDFFKIL